MAFTIPRVNVGTAGRFGKISRLGWLVIASTGVLLVGYRDRKSTRLNSSH